VNILSHYNANLPNDKGTAIQFHDDFPNE